MFYYYITRLIIFVCFFSNLSYSEILTELEDEIKVFTVATEATDGYYRFIRSADGNNIKVEVLGMGTVWKGGDMQTLGGGYKINLLRQALEKYKENKNMIILFTDAYDVIFTSGMEEILKKFKATDSKVLFSAEHFCWPIQDLATEYPTVQPNSARFLNSGMFIGYAPEIYEIIKKPLLDNEDDQLFYTLAFLNTELRTKLKLKLDTTSEIFQNLNGAQNDIKLDISVPSTEGVLHNILFETTPSIIHGNGPSKVTLNAFANYIGTFKEKRCLICEENNIIIDKFNLPIVSLGIFAENPVPFFEEFLDKILALVYPKENINIFIHTNTEYHNKLIGDFKKNNEKYYKSIKLIFSYDEIEEKKARKLAVQQAILKKSDYLFVVDSDVHIDNPETLMDLLSFNRTFIAPVMPIYNGLWSNFWGALSKTKYYARSHDYVDIVSGGLRGMWNVPFVSSCYLVKKQIFEQLTFEHSIYDPDMALCTNLLEKGIFMNIVNLKTYGHMINNEEYNISYARPDFYTLFTNPEDWNKRYIHKDYWSLLEKGAEFMQPCPDVYWFPIVTDKFCDELVAIMEHFGKWSGGTNKDDRITGGYEAVPTRDIHMKQVGLESIWLKFLKDYVRPLQEAVFIGYYHNPPRALMNFVVRYRPDEQPFLRPHHDSSTFTINVALNQVGIDYVGGGCRFIRYNCTVADTKKGWMLMHPGRLTHFHEGLKVTEGTRYIMISFIDP